MDETVTTTPDETSPHRRVRTDIVAGGGLLAVVIVGHLVWHASDAGIVAAFAGR